MFLHKKEQVQSSLFKYDPIRNTVYISTVCVCMIERRRRGKGEVGKQIKDWGTVLNFQNLRYLNVNSKIHIQARFTWF